jgi:flagellar basal body-associated protein FliL
VAVLSQVLSIVLVGLLAGSPVLRGQDSPGAELELEVVSGGERPQLTGSSQTQEISVRIVDTKQRAVAGVAVTFQLPDQNVSGLFPNGGRVLVATTNNLGVASATGIRWDDTAGVVPIRVTAAKGMDHAGIVISQELVQPPVAAAAKKPPAPGTLAPSHASTGAASQPPITKPDVEISTTKAGANAGVPISDAPEVTISKSGSGGSSGKMKWILIGVIAAAAAGVAIAMSSKKSGSTTTASSSTANTIGAPTISIGHP